MARALLAQELGEGLWHAALLGALGAALEARGAEVAYALADPAGAWRVLGPRRPRLLAAPRAAPPVDAAGDLPPVGSFADVLDLAGLGDATSLGGLVAAWDGVLALARPDVVVADHAPALLLAVRGRLPAVEVGLGFSLPPCDLPALPALRPGVPPSGAEARVLAAANAVQAARGAPGLPSVPALFASAARLVCQLAELDPYQRVRVAEQVGPLEPLPPPLPAPRAPAWVAYLAGDDPRTEAVLAGLAATGLPGRAWVRGLAPARRDALLRAGVDLADAPLDLGAALAEASIAVHHGGTGTAHQAVAAGRPQLLVPRHMEQAMNAGTLARHGVAVAVAAASADEVTRAARALAEDREARQRAERWARLVAARRPEDPAGAVAARILALAASRG